jgi:arsenate reductase
MPAIGGNNEKNDMKNILVLCTGNSCRSQIAEGYLGLFAGNRAKVYSAGIETHGVNPKAIQVMAEDGVDISNHTSNNVDEYADVPFDYVITVCDNANENCPYLPGNFKRFHQNFPDPAKAKGTPDEVINEFRSVRNMIKEYSRDWVAENLN